MLKQGNFTDFVDKRAELKYDFFKSVKEKLQAGYFSNGSGPAAKMITGNGEPAATRRPTKGEHK
jgi:hypothetical protein